MTEFPIITLAKLINDARWRSGLALLVIDPRMTRAAEIFAESMAAKDYFHPDHTNDAGLTPQQQMAEESYRAAISGQNMLWGDETAQAAFDTWWNSPPHRDNILNPNYRAIGIAGPVEATWDHQGDVYRVWVTNFGSEVGGEGVKPETSGNPTREQRLKERAKRQAEKFDRRRERARTS